MKNKVLIVYDDWGGHHKHVASSIARKYQDSGQEVIIKTGSQLIGNNSLEVLMAVYNFLIANNLIRIVDLFTNYLIRWISPFLDAFSSESYYKLLDEIDPDLVISTTEGINKMMDYWCKEKGIPFHIYVTTVFPSVFDNLSPNAIHFCYFKESVEILHSHNLRHVQHSYPIRRGAKLQEKLGYILKYFFWLEIYKDPYKKHRKLNNLRYEIIGPFSCHKLLPKSSDGKTVLVISGSIGGRVIKEILENLPDWVNAIVVCGKDQKTIGKLKKSRHEVYGYSDNMGELISRSDVVVFRPSAGILMDCIVANVPVVVFGRIPMADRDVGYIIEKLNLGKICKRPKDLKDILNSILKK